MAKHVSTFSDSAIYSLHSKEPTISTFALKFVLVCKPSLLFGIAVQEGLPSNSIVL